MAQSSGLQTWYEKISACAQMLEKYVDDFPKTSGCVKFKEDDRKKWTDDYFPNLVHGGPHLLDDQFYTGNADSCSHLGIGTDGEFSAYELFQFMYRLYKEIALQVGK